MEGGGAALGAGVAVGQGNVAFRQRIANYGAGDHPSPARLLVNAVARCLPSRAGPDRPEKAPASRRESHGLHRGCANIGVVEPVGIQAGVVVAVVAVYAALLGCRANKGHVRCGERGRVASCIPAARRGVVVVADARYAVGTAALLVDALHDAISQRRCVVDPKDGVVRQAHDRGVGAGFGWVAGVE